MNHDVEGQIGQRVKRRVARKKGSLILQGRGRNVFWSEGGANLSEQSERKTSTNGKTQSEKEVRGENTLVRRGGSKRGKKASLLREGEAGKKKITRLDLEGGSKSIAFYWKGRGGSYYRQRRTGYGKKKNYVKQRRRGFFFFRKVLVRR